MRVFFSHLFNAFDCVEGINLAVPVHSNMEKPEQYGRMLNVSFVVIGMLYTSFALLAYSFFLKDTQPIIIQNLTGWIASVVKVLVCLNVAATFPVQLFPVVQLLERAAFGVAEHQISCSSVRTRTFWLRNLLRTGLVLVIVGISIAIPFFEVVVSLVGGLGNGSAGFILPAILHLMVFKGRSPRWRVVANWALLVIGVATVILVTVFGVIKVVHEFQHQGNNTTR
jgi:amino acid permease